MKENFIKNNAQIEPHSPVITRRIKAKALIFKIGVFFGSKNGNLCPSTYEEKSSEILIGTSSAGKRGSYETISTTGRLWLVR